MSTASTGAPHALIASIAAPATPATGALSPVPKRASTTAAATPLAGHARRPPPRPLHEHVPGRAVLDRPAVEGAHLLGRDRDHRRAFISRTAAAMPTSTARATIEWPMFSSTTAGMAAIAAT